MAHTYTSGQHVPKDALTLRLPPHERARLQRLAARRLTSQRDVVILALRHLEETMDRGERVYLEVSSERAADQSSADRPADPPSG